MRKGVGSGRGELDAERHLASYKRWSKLGKVVSGAFLLAFAMSLIASFYEYYTMEYVWMPPAAITFAIVMVFSGILTVTMKMELDRKEKAIEALRETIASLEKAEK